jgi:hypothetical protein
MPAFLLLGLWISGCDVGYAFSQNAVVQVDVPAQTTNTFSTSQDLNLASSSSSLPIGNLDSVQIPEIVIQVSDIGTDNKATIVSGSLVMTDLSDSSFASLTLPFSGLSVLEGAVVDVIPTSEQVASLQAPLIGKHDLHIVYNATVDALPAQFELTASIHLVAEVAL